MITSLYTADIKLNKTDKDYTKYLVVMNSLGVLLVNKGLYILSFDTEEEFKKEVDILDNNLKHVGDISL